MKIPYMLVVGAKEVETRTVAVNVRGAGEKQRPKPVPIHEFVEAVKGESLARSQTLSAAG
jgi:threonyl-tRNA synthetase